MNILINNEISRLETEASKARREIINLQIKLKTLDISMRFFKKSLQQQPGREKVNEIECFSE